MDDNWDVIRDNPLTSNGDEVPGWDNKGNPLGPTSEPVGDLNVDLGAEETFINDLVGNTGVEDSLSDYLRLHPGANAEDVLAYMSTRGDEWAEKYLDYMLEKQSLQSNNQYTANREDTAYQRLVEDLRSAGLNPAMMYGNSASPQVSNSLGYLKQNEGANSRTVGNYSKLKSLLLSVFAYQYSVQQGSLDSFWNNVSKFVGMVDKAVSWFN